MIYKKASFIAEDKKINYDLALKCARFEDLSDHHVAINRSTIWVKNTLVRIYFDFWSQNSLPPIKYFSSSYYDATENECFLIMDCYGTIKNSISCINKFGNFRFSGAKTRRKIKDFVEKFYDEKTNW